MHALNLACLPCFFEFLRSFWRILIARVLKYLRSEVHKRREILSHTLVFYLARRILLRRNFSADRAKAPRHKSSRPIKFNSRRFAAIKFYGIF